MATHSSYYQSKLDAGQRFQDFVARRLYGAGIILVNFQSREFQYQVGENMLGLEIKFDDQFKKTGNFWIEIAEKTSPMNPTWVPSGIHRSDSSWLYGIGDYTEFWIFAIRTLQEYEVRQRPRIIENGTKTSRGFLLSRPDGSPLSARQFDWSVEPPLVLLQHEGRNREPGEDDE